MREVYAVYPRGDRVGLTADVEPVAWFVYQTAAERYKHALWPDTAEVRVVTIEEVRDAS